MEIDESSRRRARRASCSISTCQSMSTKFAMPPSDCRPRMARTRAPWAMGRRRRRRPPGEARSALPRRIFCSATGGRFLGPTLRLDTAGGRLMSSTEWLVEHLDRVPLLVIPLRAISPAWRWRRLVRPGNGVRVDLPRGVELPARVAHPWVRHLHHDAPSAAGSGVTRRSRDPGHLCAGLLAARGAVAGRHEVPAP